MIFFLVSNPPGLTDVCFLKNTNGAPAEFKDNPGVVAAVACCRAGEDKSFGSRRHGCTMYCIISNGFKDF